MDSRFLWAIAVVILAYLLGSINFAVIFSKLFIQKDVRDYGSGNAGMTNVMRVAGILPGLCTFVCDALKGFAACSIGRLVFAHLQASGGEHAAFFLPVYGAYFCGLACILGHVFPLYFSFRGGKGVAVSVGIFAVCNPPAIALGLVVFGIVLLLSRIVSLSSLVATVVVVALSILWRDPSASTWLQVVLIVSAGLIVFLKHKENIGRLVRGEEKKLKSKKAGAKHG